MSIHKLPIFVALLFSMTLVSLAVQAQDMGTPIAPPTVNYNQSQLDQMLAPIALYPDPLLGQILMASTYPLEVVEAARWLQSSGNASLTGDQLAQAVEQQPWAPSVKALVAVPQVLTMMNTNLQWTEQLGDAFLAQQNAVMNSVQQLRQRAQASGALTTTPQQVVSTQGSDIIIAQANPDVLYVPMYNPAVVYGIWEYPAYPPFAFYPAGYVWRGAFIGFGAGFVVGNVIWGWDRWDWYHHRIDIDDSRFSYLNRGRPPLSPGFWQHDPDHRHGVPYRDAATRVRFQGAAPPSSQRSFRGYTPVQTPQQHTTSNSYVGTHTPAYHTNIAATTQAQHQVVSPTVTRAAPQQHLSAPARVERPATPLFESFSHDNNIHAQAVRGATSRATALTPVHISPPPPANHGGGQRNDNRGNENDQRH